MITEVYMPKTGMDMQEGTIIRWLKNVGDRVAMDEPIMEIETDKTAMEAESPGTGILLKKLYDDGALVPVLTVVGYVGDEGETLPETPKAAVFPNGAALQAGKTALPKIAATPYAKTLAGEHGVDLALVPHTGGGITSKDVLEYMASAPNTARLAGSGEDMKGLRRRKLTSMRRVIARRVSASHAEIPPVTQNTPVDVTELLALRAAINEGREKSDRVSINDFAIAAAARAVSEFERFRMTLDGGEYVISDRIDIGVAVSADDGLYVPVVRNADGKNIFELSAEMKTLAEKARARALAPGETGDARITVSNVGMYGVHSFTPIVNRHEAAIVGVCAVFDELALADGQVAVRKKMMLSVTFDHRIVNGAEAARFANRIKELLENPRTFIIK
ncbi:MAG: dihydrolipoamide acetyltransferase family protein [Oscillospiraceae bacterium]